MIDIWESPNCLPLLVMIAHYMDENGDLQYSVLALHGITGTPTEENIAATFIDVMQTNGVTTNIGYGMMNNITSNDIMWPVVGNYIQELGILRGLTLNTVFVTMVLLLTFLRKHFYSGMKNYPEIPWNR